MKYNFVLLILIAGVLLPGCISYTTLQTAETLEPGKVLIGGGTALMFGGNDVGFQPEVNARIGIINNFDIGAKYVIPSLFFADGKWRLISDPVSLSFDLGWSTFSYDGNSGKSKGVSTGWYPMLLIGKEHWYAGVRPVYFITKGEVEFFGLQKFEGSGWLYTNVVVGGVLGSKVRLMPELNVMIPKSGEINFVPALGLQFVF
jgi:hypothetical protein